MATGKLVRFVVAFAAACAADASPMTPGPTGGVDSGMFDSGGAPGFDGGAMTPPDSSVLQDSGTTFSDTGISTPDTGTPSAGSAVAHVSDSCDLSTFAGFVLNIGSIESTCANAWMDPGEVVQFLVGESTGAPPAAGRTYTIVPQAGAAYPADGTATGLITGSGFGTLDSGTLTIMQISPGNYSGSYSGSYSAGGTATKSGSFNANHCDLEPGSCD